MCEAESDKFPPSYQFVYFVCYRNLTFLFLASVPFRCFQGLYRNLTYPPLYSHLAFLRKWSAINSAVFTSTAPYSALNCSFECACCETILFFLPHAKASHRNLITFVLFWCTLTSARALLGGNLRKMARHKKRVPKGTARNLLAKAT